MTAKSFRDPIDEWLKDTMGDAADPMVTELAKLTDQQYEFCRAYVATGSPVKAAEVSGVTKRQNPHLLVHLPKIAACINILHARREAEIGQKSSAEIMKRLINTPVVEAETFNFSDEALVEREAARHNKNLGSFSTDELGENLLADPPDPIMQLPKVRVEPAQSFGPQWVIERLVTVAERCMQIEAVYDRKGRPLGKFQFNANAALKAMDLLGKTMAMYKDKVEVSGDVSTFSREEIDNRIKGLLESHPSLLEGVIDVTPAKEKKDVG